MIEPELKKKWVDALRSGEYKQTESCLHNDEGFCCLGVLADLKGVKWIREEGVSFGKETFVFYGDDTDKEIQYDVEPPLAWINNSDVENTLINMNDGNESSGVRKHSFAEIADFIENSVDI